MRLRSITTFVNGRFGLVRLERVDDAVGWGQFGLNDPDLSAIFLHRHLAPLLLQGECPDAETYSTHIEAALYKHRGVHLWRALAGIDTALWDLKGKDAGQPVWALLGGCGDAVPVYASSMSRSMDVVAELDRFAKAIDGYGFRALKAKIGPRLGKPDAEHRERSAALLDGLDRRFPTIVRKVDANRSWGTDHAIGVGKDLQARGYTHYEEPCPFWDLDATRRVSDALEIPVAGGEQDGCLATFQRMAADRVVDILQPDVGYVGGFSRARAVAHIAAEHGLPCMPHSSNPSAIHTYSLHLVASIPNAGHFLERSIEDLDGHDAPMDPPPIIDGAVRPQEDPGWGYAPRAAWLQAAQVNISR